MTKVLMLGWELPPFNSGGLGEACLGLSRALSKKGVSINFVLPKRLNINLDFINLIFADVDEKIGKLASCYTTCISWSKIFPSESFSPPQNYVKSAFRFAEKIELIIKNLKDEVDIIHAHDWMTFPAAMSAKDILGKPLVIHVHSTEFDRTGGNCPNPQVYGIEKKGFEKADRILPVGGFMKSMIVEKYGISQDKVKVIYNGIDQVKKDLPPALTVFKQLGYKVVLYLGRITLQKGPDYFVRAAKRVSDFYPKVIFVVAGSGDMQDFMVSEAAKLEILDKFIFTGFLRGDEKDRIFQAADLYVMPSVSEPFGIAALEAVVNGTPVLISKQSGVSEILKNALKVDFWDIDEMANKIISVLKYGSLKRDLSKEGSKEVTFLTWSRSADEVLNVYEQLV
ncbi:hypothetical protein A2686_03490 [Candidatus Woesebacteria bacterium RIFCSPHIGHO2_01_FULL_38_10]|uniref:4-alpha-glucanotransferase n=1 Tax=Candidatus Woesebacteria bacterium RIFCSPLOWO2_01_FULL_39_10b TaxID=1802517 RepID=A0A1F8BAL2_9BACT|nr:MAG: hypothetical protein A2686_03490 [Candidatus Woesebacteria bacterium RIFCSPHIGHO2_01_FULL_38_10]OGM60719.1 MAG: hypothetical protein A2892_01590 [Candidatus Woesebacteria bacterium RIFCSPLOWO2_01_FULL_39_10b]